MQARAGADGDVVDAHQERLAFDVDEAHVEVAGEVVLHVAVDLGVVERGLELVLEVVAELGFALGFGGHLFAADLAGLAEADDAGDVEGAAAHAALVAAAVDLLGDLDARVAAANVERADSFGAVDLVAG